MPIFRLSGAGVWVQISLVSAFLRGEDEFVVFVPNSLVSALDFTMMAFYSYIDPAEASMRPLPHSAVAASFGKIYT